MIPGEKHAIGAVTLDEQRVKLLRCLQVNLVNHKRKCPLNRLQLFQVLQHPLFDDHKHKRKRNRNQLQKLQLQHMSLHQPSCTTQQRSHKFKLTRRVFFGG